MKKLIQLIGAIVCSASLLYPGTWQKKEAFSISSEHVQGVMDDADLSVSRSGDKFFLYSVKVGIFEAFAVGRKHIDADSKPYLNGYFPVTVDVSFDDGLEFAQTWQADVPNGTVYPSQAETFINAIRKAKKLKLVIRHDGVAGQYEFDVADLPEFGLATQAASK